jgi:lipopolysaccharide transport system permease protein
VTRRSAQSVDSPPPLVGEVSRAASHRLGPARGERAWTENAPSRGWFPRIDLHELWSSRELVLILALRNIKIRYKQTLLGIAWAVLQPLAGVAIFTIVLGRLANIPSEGVPYPVFVFAGLALWMYFSNAASAAAESLVQYRDLVTKVYFPRLLAPLAAILPGLIDLGISLLAVGVFMAIFGVAPSAAIVFLPLCILAAVLVTFGVALWLSALNARYRDVRNALTFLLQIWLFATPVVFPSSLAHGGWHFLLAINPIAGLVEVFRWSLIGAPAPGSWVLVSFGVGFLILSSGIIYFARVQRRFADFI